MENTFFKTWLILLTVQLLFGSSQTIETDNSTQTANSRDGKVFSLFSIVSFKNTGCRSQSALTTGQSSARNGTCYTSTECSSKGGTASGNCAAGFGVCCIFLVSSGTISQNCTYLRNPGFPTALTTTTGITYTINKCTADICYIRLDFESFETVGPVAGENLGGLCQDMLTFTVTGNTYPTICGTNTGQHMYLDLSNKATDTAILNFNFATGVTSTTRQWEIKVSQIECSNVNRPPPGCEQFYTTTSGRISTFNFFSTGALQHLASQDITACVRRRSGYCCIQYTPCNGLASAFDAFALDSVFGSANARFETICSGDYVRVPGASFECGATSPIFTKFCTSVLNPATDLVNLPICDCGGLFNIHFHTDALNEVLDPMILGGPSSRGACFDYNLIPCTGN